MLRLTAMTAEEYEAIVAVHDVRDCGRAFEVKCQSLVFYRAVEKARQWRAFSPRQLHLAVHYPHLVTGL